MKSARPRALEPASTLSPATEQASPMVETLRAASAPVDEYGWKDLGEARSVLPPRIDPETGLVNSRREAIKTAKGWRSNGVLPRVPAWQIKNYFLGAQGPIPSSVLLAYTLPVTATWVDLYDAIERERNPPPKPTYNPGYHEGSR